MIKFFRHIRKSLLIKNQNGKYFKYAIGEIILVVIGILIALQINNWNDHRKTILNEKELLESLEKESIKNLALLEVSQTINDSFTKQALSMITKLNQGETEFSTEELSESFNYTTGIIEAPVLDGIVASNSDILVKHKDLIEEFRDLQYTYGRIKKSEYYLDEFWNSKISEFFVDCGFFFEGFSNTDPPINIMDIETGGYTKKQFVALLNMKISLQNYREIRRQQAEEKTMSMIKLLTNENAE